MIGRKVCLELIGTSLKPCEFRRIALLFSLFDLVSNLLTNRRDFGLNSTSDIRAERFDIIKQTFFNCIFTKQSGQRRFFQTLRHRIRTFLIRLGILSRELTIRSRIGNLLGRLRTRLFRTTGFRSRSGALSRLLNRRGRLIIDIAAVSIGEFTRSRSLWSRRTFARSLDIRKVFIVVLLAIDVFSFGESLTNRQNRLRLLIHSFRASLSICVRIGHLQDRMSGLEVLLTLRTRLFDAFGDGLILSRVVGTKRHVDALALGLAFEFSILGIHEVRDPFRGGLALLQSFLNLFVRDHAFEDIFMSISGSFLIAIMLDQELLHGIFGARNFTDRPTTARTFLRNGLKSKAKTLSGIFNKLFTIVIRDVIKFG